MESIKTISPNKGNNKLVKFLIILLGILILLDFDLWIVYQNRKTGFFQPKNLIKLRETSDSRKTPKTIQERFDYVEGVIGIWFVPGVYYKSAKELLATYGLELDGANPEWEKTGFQPDDSTRIKDKDYFLVKVPLGKEDEMIEILSRRPIIRSVVRSVKKKQER